MSRPRFTLFRLQSKFQKVTKTEFLLAGKGAIAEYPAQLVVFDSTATVVRGPQSVSKVKCMCQVLN